MEAEAIRGILRVLEDVPDPRHHNVHHRLFDILVIALFGVISGCDSWPEVVDYGRDKQDWLKTFLELPKGIPSHHTFGRVFARLNPDALERCLRAWMAQWVSLSGGTLVAVDGKSLRRSFSEGWARIGMTHMVSAFVAANRLVFAQQKADSKGQELDAILKLLELLDLNGAVVSVDALGCQTKVAKTIVAAGGQYILQAKANQPALRDRLANVMAQGRLLSFEGWSHDAYEQTDGDHGRIETRRVDVVWDTRLLGPLASRWPGLRCLIAVQATREIKGKLSRQTHYYISSLDRRHTARQIAGWVRGHWSVENSLHWQLDVSFSEDRRRLRIGNAAENFSRLCRLALNLLRRDTTRKLGIAGKRKACDRNNDYLLHVLQQLHPT